MMSQQDNIATTQRLGKAVNSGNLEALRDVFAPNVIDRDPASDQQPGPEGFIHFFTGFRAAFPDLTIAVEQLVADEGNVEIAYTASPM
jgi:predicted ester cyclase